MIPFNKPVFLGPEQNALKQLFKSKKLSGDGPFTKKCHSWLEKNLNCKKALLTTSCTAALEMAAILCNIQPGDEVIMPSYTFVSTANAFVLRGAKVVFVDIRPDTMNIDENLIEKALTNKTKVICVVHYAGISCEMDKIMDIALKHDLKVVEDAAQGLMSKYKKKPLGTIGDIGCYSFHESKNYTCGEGGAIILNNASLIERAEIIREKGTNRSKFFRGEVAKYTWFDIGSSYLLSELNAAYLYPQLENAEKINNNRLKSWRIYYKLLSGIKNSNLELPYIPDHCEDNAHMFYIKVKNLKIRENLIKYLKNHNISAVFHYIPLHSSSISKKYCRFNGKDIYTIKESKKILRLPMYYGLQENEIKKVVDCIKNFFN